MQTCNIHEAKTQFSRLIERVESGEEILIARAGKPVARLAPLQTPARSRVLGLGRERFHLPPEFGNRHADTIRTMFESGD